LICKKNEFGIREPLVVLGPPEKQIKRTAGHGYLKGHYRTCKFHERTADHGYFKGIKVPTADHGYFKGIKEPTADHGYFKGIKEPTPAMNKRAVFFLVL
jgi:hypothetical protein